MKSQLLEYYHCISPTKKNVKTQASTGKYMFTVFWDCRAIIHQQYMVRGTKINAVACMEIVNWFKQWIRCISRGNGPVFF
jgi:hypothetical protein